MKCKSSAPFSLNLPAPYGAAFNHIDTDIRQACISASEWFPRWLMRCTFNHEIIRHLYRPEKAIPSVFNLWCKNALISHNADHHFLHAIRKTRFDWQTYCLCFIWDANWAIGVSWFPMLMKWYIPEVYTIIYCNQVGYRVDLIKRGYKLQ